MLKLSAILFSFLALLIIRAHAQPPDKRDNRIKPGLKIGDVISDPVPDTFLTGEALFKKNSQLPRQVIE
jgi:hypothetical protein